MSNEPETTHTDGPPVMTDAAALAADALSRAPKPTVSAPENAKTTPENETTKPPVDHSEMGVDSLNRPFDPDKFRPEKDKAGRWKNRNGGRPRKTPLPSPEPPAVKPESNLVIPPSAQEKPPVARPEETAETTSGHDAETTPAAADATAEAFCKIAYAGIGMTTGCPEESTPPPAEHKALKEATASFLSARGLVATGAWLFGIMWVLYLLKIGQKPNTLAFIRRHFSGPKPEKNVTPEKPAERQPPPVPETAPQMGFFPPY